MVFVIYVGDNEVFISHFNRLLKGELEISSDLSRFSVILKKNINSLPVMVLFEKSKMDDDIKKIKLIKQELPLAYIVLVTSEIGKNEIPQYQAAGLKDTISPNVSETRLNNGLEFIAKNQMLIADSAHEHLPIGTYEIPIWKRCFDILFSLAAIVILSPILIVVAAMIRIESQGPVIYKSKRVGSNYEIFDFYKFRSMYKDADKRLKEFLSLNQYKEVDPLLYDYSDEITQIPVVKYSLSDSSFVSDNSFVSDDEVISEKEFLREKGNKQRNNFIKYENDPRITKMGKFIRKFSIDEVPQLINILLGDMSIVGNRPLPLYEAEQLTSDQYIDRFLGPAGLTGLWQVEKRGDSGKLSPEERKQLDIYYAKNYSFWMDLKIVLKTFTAFIQKENV
ncbi:MAG TPA: sugar transferase [Rikenellaceae bacterium]|nr:sugar transferase [Rikenellaceae bacterium]